MGLTRVGVLGLGCQIQAGGTRRGHEQQRYRGLGLVGTQPRALRLFIHRDCFLPYRRPCVPAAAAPALQPRTPRHNAQGPGCEQDGAFQGHLGTTEVSLWFSKEKKAHPLSPPPFPLAPQLCQDRDDDEKCADGHSRGRVVVGSCGGAALSWAQHRPEGWVGAAVGRGFGASPGMGARGPWMWRMLLAPNTISREEV